MVALGALCGYVYLHHGLRDTPLSGRFLDGFFALTYGAGLVGARLFSRFTDEPLYIVDAPLWSIFIPGPMSFYGGALAGGLVGYGYCWWKRVAVGWVLDCTIPALLIALAVGRVGCFLNGDDYGIPVALGISGQVPWWAVTFPNHELPIPRYPVQLMESLGCLVGVVGVRVLSQQGKIRYPGQRGVLGILGYSLLRFGLEFLRGDEREAGPPGWLSPAQWVSLGLFLGAVGGLIWIVRNNTCNRSVGRA